MDYNTVIEEIVIRFSAFLHEKSLTFATTNANSDQEQCLFSQWLNVTNYLESVIEETPREIIESDIIDSKINSLKKEEKEILKTIYSNIELGRGINSLLSSRVLSPNKYDQLLMHWNIKHIHVSHVVDFNRKCMKSNRSSKLLFGIFTRDKAYLIDILDHPKRADAFTMQGLLEIIERNGWINLTGFSPKPLEMSFNAAQLSDKEIQKAYNSGVNWIVFKINEKEYVSTNSSTLYGNNTNINDGYNVLNNYVHDLCDANAHVEVQDIQFRVDIITFVFVADGDLNHMRIPLRGDLQA